jgi:ATP-dependent exoDNAse (exonuclease V) beta subunit
MSGALMERINMVFEHIWKGGVINDSSLHVGYEPLLPPGDAPWWSERNGGRAAAHPMEIMLYAPSPPPGEEPPEAENMRAQRKKLAAGVASKLRSMIENGVEIWDKGIPGFRPLKWSDVAVLVRARTAYPEIEEAFEESGVPFAFDLSREFINRGEVRDLIAYIRALDRPDDELALAGWMESPFSGMPQGAGLKLVLTAREASGALKTEFGAEYPEQAERLEHLRRTARLISPSRAVSALLEDESWIAAYPKHNRNRVRANIRRGVEILSEYEASCGRNLASCADYLRRELRSGEPIEEPGQFAGGEDALRVMTVHSSKGLEFPVVVLMFMEALRRNDSKSGTAFVSRSLGAVSRKLPDGAPSVRHAWHKAIEDAEEAEESARMLYVAMTRAQERLICCGLPEKTNPRGEDWLSMLLAANDKNGSPIPVEYTGGECAASSRRNEQEKISEGGDGGHEPAVWSAKPRAAALSATAYSLLSWCPVSYRIRYRQGRELKWERQGAPGGGSELGTLTHWILSKWDFELPSLKTFLPDEIPPGGMESELTEIPPKLRHIWRRGVNRASCRRWLEDFAASPACDELRKALASGTLQREVAFSVGLGGVNMVGGIDVFWEDSSGCHVRDWKITSEEDAPHEMYDAQVEFYAMACRVSHPGAKIDAGLIYLRSEDSGAEIRRITRWDELSLAIRNAAREASSAEIRRRGDCSRCPFGSCCTHRHYSH